MLFADTYIYIKNLRVVKEMKFWIVHLEPPNRSRSTYLCEYVKFVIGDEVQNDHPTAHLRRHTPTQVPSGA